MDAERYLARIGGAPSDDLPTLVGRHLATVPFENLSIHLGETISLEPADLYGKIVERRRGGFCHELNGAFAWLLGELGYDVDLLGARVCEDSGTSQPLSHTVLRVVVAGRPWLADVGFGWNRIRPVPLDVPDADRLRPVEHGDLEMVDDDGEPAYHVETRARSRADFEPTCFWQATSPASWFAHGPLCTLPAGGGQVTLTGRRLRRTAVDGSRTDQHLTGDEALAAYREVFGIELDRLPVPLHPPEPRPGEVDGAVGVLHSTGTPP